MRQPSIPGYAAFLTNVAHLNMANLPPFTGTGTLVEGSQTLTVVSVDKPYLNLVDHALVTDANASIPAWTTVGKPLVPCPPVGIGTYQLSAAALTTQAAPEVITATNEWIVGTLFAAMTLVNRAIELASPFQYAMAVYNLATDRLINYAPDIPDQTYWQDVRKDMNISTPAVGTVTASADQGSSVTVVSPEFLKTLTLADLQMMKTPWGREYLGIAQAFGPNLFGLT